VTAFGLLYPPHNRSFRGPDGDLPPLVVTSHGGPTASAYTGLSIGTQLFTSRGFAVLDVDYGGSTGYGRDYRKRLEGEWGVVDLDDCVNGARWLAEQGRVDGERLSIRGGSASGYTTLCAVTFRDVFGAGTSYFGIGDLETFAAQTHKFESRYLDRLIGPYPERKDLYHERSPLNFTDRISCPVLILQGADDRRRPVGEAPPARVSAVPRRGSRVPGGGEHHPVVRG
jgi:dipeptidyl aminopeptidase/acylaminoacyl peptidase